MLRNNIALLLIMLVFGVMVSSHSVVAPTRCCEPQTSCIPCEPDEAIGDCYWAGVLQDTYCCGCEPPFAECIDGGYRCSPENPDILEKCVGGTWTGWQSCPCGCDVLLASCAECPTPPPGFPDIDEFRPADIAVQPGSITVTFYLLNDDTIDMPNDKDYLIEVQPRPVAGLSVWVGAEQVCDPNHPENVHREYRIDAGDSIEFTITCPVQAGTYDIYAVSTDGCCVDTNGDKIPCSFIGPYKNTKLLGRVTVPSVGDVNVHQIQRSYECEDARCVYTDTDVVKEVCANGCSDGVCIVNPQGTLTLELMAVILTVSVASIIAVGAAWLL